MFEKFTGIYKLTKTLRFELKPVGKTLQHMEESGVLEHDRERCAKYQHVKDLLDAQHSALIERAMAGMADVEVDWTVLAEGYAHFRTSDKSKEERDALEALNLVYRKKIVAALEADERYDVLTSTTPKDIFKRMMDEDDAVKTFATFSCYFKGFQENRKNLYSVEKQATAVATRLVNENFPRFLSCCEMIRHIGASYPQILADAERELSEILLGEKLSEVFSVERYSYYLTQAGIERVNNLLGGFTHNDGTKIKGVNEYVNLYRQQHDEGKGDRKLVRLPQLYKQILADRETISFVHEEFEKDQTVLAAVQAFGKKLAEAGTVDKLQKLTAGLSCNAEIYIDKNELSNVSRILCGDWATLKNWLEEQAECRVSGIAVIKRREKEVAKFMNRAEYPLSDFAELQGLHDVAATWRTQKAEEIFGNVAKTFQAAQTALTKEDEAGLRERTDDVAAIKEYLDSVQGVLHLVKPLAVSPELGRDMSFYGEFDQFYAELSEVIPLYNRVRNYITRKPSEVKKMKLMFDSPTLADGWDQNKETQNKTVLFERAGAYYLGILNPHAKTKIDFRGCEGSGADPVYRKMVYKLLPGPNKMLPKVFFSAKGRAIYEPDAELLRRYRNGDYKKGKTFDLAFCHRLIDFFKKSISMHEDWRGFGFKFSPTSSYTGIDEFYREISDQGYKIRFVDITAEKIDKWVEDGSLFLFKLHNKDFAPGATGRANLHTIYWRNLFTPENLNNVVYKLNGEAELFCRYASIVNPTLHKVGEKMINRVDKDGHPLPESVFGELFRFVNGWETYGTLSIQAKRLYDEGKVTVKPVSHEIVKDARYTQNKFFFHVPITINAKAADKPAKFDDLVNAAVADEERVNVIGIDRGERNLLYVAVINARGELLEQRSFNMLSKTTYQGTQTTMDYHAKLDQMEKDRDEARKSWSEIGKIKDLKAGYLSLVIHEITQMMVKHNAVIALEDLNFGFKRGRFAIEKQVYQKFEKALIDKLNYLMFKDVESDSLGGALRGIQLTDKFVSFERLGKQTGFLYYVPAAYTSKIDPTTGFTNLFDLRKCTNAENISAFFKTFDAIKYDRARNAFAFSFNYRNFKTRLKGHKTDWVVYSADRRLDYDRDAKAKKEVFPTRIILDALTAAGQKVRDGYDLLEYVRTLTPGRENAALLKAMFYAFERTLQMRNSDSTTDEDYIQSPVMNKQGQFFDSRSPGKNLPQDADANGAYHIALKGLYIVNGLKEGKKAKDLKLDHETWFRFAQTR